MGGRREGTRLSPVLNAVFAHDQVSSLSWSLEPANMQASCLTKKLGVIGNHVGN